MLTENKFSKYLIYAIGEIFLVVIGILIALQINNWNENQKLEAIKKNYYEQITIDLRQQTTNILDQKAFLETNISLYDSYIDKFENSDWSAMEALGELGSLNRLTQTLVLSNNTLETLKQTGDIKLIPVSLRNELIELERLMIYIIQLENRHVAMYIESINEATTQGFSPIIFKYFNKAEIMGYFDDTLRTKLLLIAEDTFYWKWTNEKVRLEILDDISDQIDLINKLIQLEIEK